MTALVLDLRNNPGGLLKAAIDVADEFLDKGQVIVSTRGRTNTVGRIRVGEIRYTAGHPALVKVPMAVLINGGSASASEILAGALQDHKRAILIGDTSYGKGSVQSIIRLEPDGKCAIRLTTALYYTPNGRKIHHKGIDPDVPVYVTPGEWIRVQQKRAIIENPAFYSDEDKKKLEDVTDQALRRAVDLLQAIVIFGNER